jgi:hypothetical protein
MSKIDIKAMKAQVKANKPPKTIKVKSLIVFVVVVVVSMAIGAFSGVVINNAINDNINQQVESRLKVEK